MTCLPERLSGVPHCFPERLSGVPQCFRSLSALSALILLSIAVVGAERLTDIPNPRTRDGTWVTDTPGILRADTIASLNATLGEFERTNGAEMAVVVIRSLDGLSIEEAAVKLFELWKIGKKSKDNGLLLLWSTGDRRVRVEVGYGLEGVLNDGKVGAILDTYVMPKFKSGQFDEGVLAGVDALLRVAREEPVELSSARSESYEPRSGGVIAAVLGLLAAIPIGVGSIFGLRKWRRVRRRRCPACQTWMTRLGESADDALLEEGQRPRSGSGALITTCGSARPAGITSRCGTPNGSAATKSARSARTARSRPRRKSSRQRPRSAAAARWSSRRVRSAPSAASTRGFFRVSSRAPRHQEARRVAGPAVLAAVARVVAEPAGATRVPWGA